MAQIDKMELNIIIILLAQIIKEEGEMIDGRDRAKILLIA